MISRRNIVRLIRQIFAVFQYSGRALELVWNTSRTLTVILAILTVVAGLLPAAIAYIGKLIVDSVILAAQSGLDSDSASAPGYGLRNWAFIYLGLEAIVVAILAGSQRGLSIS